MITSVCQALVKAPDRLGLKTLDRQFRTQIERGANCPPFVSEAILRTAKQVFDLDGQSTAARLNTGQIKFMAIASEEPPGKPLKDCLFRQVLLTLDAGQEDADVHAHQGITALRRLRLMRMATEAQDQRALLTYEDIALRLLNCSVRTVVRDIKHLARQEIVVPTRGQQKDIGPGQCHRVKAVQLYLSGLDYHEISRRIYHSLSSVQNYVMTFGRVAYLRNRGHAPDEIAFVIQRSLSLVSQYIDLHNKALEQSSWSHRLSEILQQVKEAKLPSNLKKGGPTQS